MSKPLIFLWAHPRSMSTALERVMRERGDFDCLHEPFLHYYYLEKSPRRLPHFEIRDGHPVSYVETRDWILERAEKRPVFAKDMSYYVIPELLEDEEFCRRARHCFLVRDPRRAIMSYHRLDPEVCRDEIGIEAQWRLYAGLQLLGAGDLPVIEAEAVQRDPLSAVSALWQALGLEPVGEALQWRRGEVPDDWRYVEGWHESVNDSSGIRPPDRDDAEISAAFEQLCRGAPQLREYYDHHRPFYQRLQAGGLTKETTA